MLHLQQVLLNSCRSRLARSSSMSTLLHSRVLSTCSYVRAASDFKGLRAVEQAVTASHVMKHVISTPRHNSLVGKPDRYYNGKARAWPVMNVA